MSDLPKAYDPSLVEEKWQSRWIEEGCFKADPASEKPAYSVVIPPPNVTGVLHLGHVLNNTIQDILVRRARQKGYEALWLPGTDHAGIATQVRVEKDLKQTTGRSRHDLGREAFLEKVWEWKEKHGGIIINQLHKLGCSCDWDRERFTMDEGCSRAVREVFVVGRHHLAAKHWPRSDDRHLRAVARFCQSLKFPAGMPVGDPMEIALVEFATQAVVGEGVQVLSELPFDSERRRMSVVVTQDGERWLRVDACQGR